MEMKFPKSICKYLKPALREVRNQELTQEIRLTDGMPDIGRILSAWGQVILRSKEWRSDSISSSGGVMVWVLYAPEDGSPVQCIESWVPFQNRWDLDGQSREGDIRIQCLLRFADARSISARKIMLRLGVAALGEAMVPDEAEVSVPGEMAEDVQLLSAVYPLRIPKEAGEKTFLMDEDLILPGSSPMPEKLIYFTMNPKITEKKVMGNKVVFRGNGNLHVLYLSEEGQLHSWDFELPFSQLADLDGSYSTDAQTNICMCITSLELDLDDESHMRMKCGLLAQYLVDDREMLTLIEDAYSPSRTVVPQMDRLQLPAILEQRQQLLDAEQEIHHDANVVADTAFLPDFPRQRRSGDALQWEIPGQFQALYYGKDGTLQSAGARWEGQWKMDADQDSMVTATVNPGSLAQAMVGGDSIQLRADVPMTLETTSDRGIPMVTGLTLEQPAEANPNRPSVILRRAGEDRLWDIAKSTGSTVEAIKAANGLENEPLRNQILLIPVP